VNLDEVKFFFLFRDWAISNFIFLADRLSGRTWYGLLDVWYHTFLAMAAILSPPLHHRLPYFSWLSLWPITFSRASTFSAAQPNNGPYLFIFCFLHSYLFLFLLCKKIRPSSLTSPLIIFRFRSLESLVCAGWPAVVGSVLFISS
jgi:hypothetical protein